jgi:hypothetical protein
VTSGVLFVGVGVARVAAPSRVDGDAASALDANVWCVVARSARAARSTGDVTAGERGDPVADGNSARFARVGAHRAEATSSRVGIFFVAVARRGERA